MVDNSWRKTNMKYVKLEKPGIEISKLSLGGHEYLPNKLSRGFNEDFAKAITPGYIFPGFGGEQRKKLLSKAFDLGVNYFDVTHDSEKEAIGRNLRELGCPYEVYIQTRPEGFCYTYDEHNAKMADYNLLKAEAQRIIKLMQRDCIDFFNLAFMHDALEHDPEYMDKIVYNINMLKKEGLVRWVCADTFAGEETYLTQINSDAFDVIYINFNFADCGAEKNVLKAARDHNMGVIVREQYMKGALFKMAAEAGIDDKNTLAHAAMKWCYNHEEVSTIIFGTNTAEHLADAVGILDSLSFTDKELEMIETIKTTNLYKEYFEKKQKEFFG